VRCIALKTVIVPVSANSSAFIFLSIMKTTRQLIEAARQLEADQNQVAEKIVSVLAKEEGKKLTRRVLPKIAAAIGQEVYMNSPCDSLLYIQTEAYLRDREGRGEPGGVKLLMPTAMGQTTMPVIDIAAIRDRNSSWLDAAIERNTNRENLLASDYPEKVDIAGENLRNAEASFKHLVSYPVADWSSIARLHKALK
jgi:hypothetical protein